MKRRGGYFRPEYFCEFLMVDDDIFSGRITIAEADYWNEVLERLIRKFETLKGDAK